MSASLNPQDVCCDLPPLTTRSKELKTRILNRKSGAGQDRTGSIRLDGKRLLNSPSWSSFRGISTDMAAADGAAWRGVVLCGRSRRGAAGAAGRSHCRRGRPPRPGAAAGAMRISRILVLVPRAGPSLRRPHCPALLPTRPGQTDPTRRSATRGTRTLNINTAATRLRFKTLNNSFNWGHNRREYLRTSCSTPDRRQKQLAA